MVAYRTAAIKVTFPASLCFVILFVFVTAACTKDASLEASAHCGGGWPDLDKAMEEAEAEVDFHVLVPTYLPATTSSIPEATIHPPDEIRILFPPCPDKISDILGPQVEITQTTQLESLPEPGYSDPPTERIQIHGISALMQQGNSPDTVSIAVSWQQAGLSLFATLTWKSEDVGPPEITGQMEMQALQVVESIVQQSEVTEPAP